MLQVRALYFEDHWVRNIYIAFYHVHEYIFVKVLALEIYPFNYGKCLPHNLTVEVSLYYQKCLASICYLEKVQPYFSIRENMLLCVPIDTFLISEF